MAHFAPLFRNGIHLTSAGVDAVGRLAEDFRPLTQERGTINALAAERKSQLLNAALIDCGSFALALPV